MGMFDRYTERARRAIFFARWEAIQSGALKIDTDHLLWACSMNRGRKQTQTLKPLSAFILLVALSLAIYLIVRLAVGK